MTSQINPRWYDRFLRTRASRVRALLYLGLLAALFGILSGLVLARFMGAAAVAAIKTVSTAGAAYAVYKLVIEKWPALKAFVKERATETIRDPLAQLDLAMTGFGIFAGTEVGPERPTASLQVISIIATDVSGDGTALRDRIVIPFFSIPFSGCHEAQIAGSAGKVDDNLVEPLRNLACGLRNCSTAEYPVRIDIRGYASDKEFACGDLALSKANNLALAELRRDSVRTILEGKAEIQNRCPQIAARPLVLDPAFPRRWQGNFDSMGRARGIGPPAIAGADASLEALARRVDILILNPGSCTLGD